jgi:acetyl-CoA carboxylase carboxyl transferase subunit alpha
MLEHSIYSVISPEGCASILWRDAARAQDAASALRITAQDLQELKIIDAIIPEPVGGAHRDPQAAINAAADQIARGLAEMEGSSGEELLRQRRAKFLAMGRNL